MTTQNYEPAISPKKLDGTMRTISGKSFDLIHPSPEMIDIQDIASGLSNQGHFNGQSPYMFPISQHCILVCDTYSLDNPDETDEMKLMALLHDASEAYTGDVINPLKILLPDFINIENSIMRAIAIRYNLPIRRMSEIKSTDLLIQNLEYDGFYRDQPITYLDPETARKLFIDRFKEFYHGK